MRTLTIAAILLASTAALAQNGTTLRVQKNMAAVYRVDTTEAISSITVGNPKIMDVAPLTDRSILIEPHIAGTTNLTFFNKDKRPIKDLTVVVDEQGSGFVRIHNKAMLNSFTTFTCWSDGCQFVGENTVAEPAPLPRGHQSINQSVSGEGQPPVAPITIPAR